MSWDESSLSGMRAEIVAALDVLFLEDERWEHTLFPGGSAVQRTWDNGTIDTIIILSQMSAYGARVTPDDKKEWSVSGPALQVIEAARELLPPDHSNAPEVTGDRR